MEKRPCLDLDQFRGALSTGQFADLDEAFRALAHFARPCRACWDRLTTLAEGDSQVFLEALTGHAAEALNEPPVALALGRLVLVSGQQDTAAELPPTHRHLLREETWGRGFEFWWLLIKEARLLALTSRDRQVKRWQAMEKALARHSCEGKSLDLELRLLIGAYRADDMRFDGQARAAESRLAEVVAQVTPCRSEIRATILEKQADLYRVNLHDYARSLDFLDQAEAALQDVRIPGRLSETHMRIGLSRLSQKDYKPAFAAFVEALRLIPQGTDPRLRCEILLHLAAIKIRLDHLGQVRPYLEEADPFFESHASDLMVAQKDWLWSHVYMDEGEFDHAERLLIKALMEFHRFGASKIDALVNLVQFYFRSRNESKLNHVLLKLVSALRQSGEWDVVVNEVKQALEGAEQSTVDTSVILDLLACRKPRYT